MASIEEFYRHLGAQVRRCRLDRGLTQEAIAARLVPRVTRASIANLELGRQRVLAHTLMQLAEILDVPLAELLTPPPDAADWASVEDALRATLRLSRPTAERLVRRLGAPA